MLVNGKPDEMFPRFSEEDVPEEFFPEDVIQSYGDSMTDSEEEMLFKMSRKELIEFCRILDDRSWMKSQSDMG